MAKILVIDDDGDLRELVASVLEAAGHEVYRAADGNRGIAIQRRERADLVITDLVMPEKEGIETIHDLREEFPGLAIIAMSGGGSAGTDVYLATAGDLGADRVLPKPFDTPTLMGLVDQLLAPSTA